MATGITVARLALPRWVSGLALISGVVIGTSCDSPTSLPIVASVRVTPNTWAFTSVRDTVQFSAEAVDATGHAIPGRTFTWRAEPSGIVSIREDGLATAIGPGIARVYAATDTISGSTRVEVIQVVKSVVFVMADIKFTALGDSTPLQVEARDARSYPVRNASFSFQSSDVDVATITPTGSVRAVSPGVATITATAVGLTATIPLQVRQDVAKVVLSPDTAMIQEGTTRQFTALLKDRNGFPVTGRSIDWTTSDARVVTVSNTGLATSKAARLGPATLMATTEGAIGQAPVYLFAPFIAVSAFGSETCALTALGKPYCWGLLNYSTGQRSEIPLAVSGAPQLSTIRTGLDLSCGLTNAGAAYCWAKAALPSASVVANAPAFVSQSLGTQAYGLGTLVYGLTASGGAYSWTDQAPSPTAVPGGFSFATISAGWGYTCGTVASGAAYCWGSNLSGELGDSTNQDRPVPTPVYGGLAFAMVSPGAGHTCGLTTGGATYCWGRNISGAFGDGTTTNSLIPVPAAGSLVLTSIAVGGGYTCGLDASGAAYCWGFNDDGSLGDGTFAQRLAPVRVAGGLRFTSLSAGGTQTCGLTGNGALYCWGRNYDREIGDGTNVKRPVPTLVSGSRP